MNIPQIQSWQLERLLNLLELHRKAFHNLTAIGFYIRPEGVDLVTFRALRPSVVNTLGATDLQWYQDTWFKTPHTALQVGYPDKVLVVGFWADNLDNLKTWLQEQLPDVHTDISSERILTERLYLE